MPNSWICVDANLVVRLVADPADERVRSIWEQWNFRGKQIAAPALLHYEVANALYQYQRLALLSTEVVRLALEAALSLPIQLKGGTDLHRRALNLAQRFSFQARPLVEPRGRGNISVVSGVG